MSPVVSVILPVYNGALYLRQAIDSILAQTFTDFEVVMMDDASTDESKQIIASYSDNRIKYYQNERNLGLIATLNRSIDLCSGKYIARMDQDDISLPERFAIQVEYLESHPETGVISSPVIGLTPGGKLRDHWPADAAAKTFEQIRRTLPKENCIAHPSIMASAEIMRKYRYAADQKGSEDWDLWLRLVRDGIRIEKTEEVLLHYRLHPDSSTIATNLRRSPQLRIAGTKWRFFRSSLAKGKVKPIVWRTFQSIGRDLGYFFKSQYLPSAARQARRVITISPVRAAADLAWLKGTPSTDHFFFFSYSHLGGAERVHAEITRVAEDKKPLVFFTGLSDRGGMEADFGDSLRVRNISAALYHPLFAARCHALLLKKISKARSPVLFGSNSRYFYDMVREVPGSVITIDLTHDVTYDGQKPVPPTMLSSLLRLDHRIFISNRALEATKAMYTRNFVDDVHFKRMQLIYNYTPEAGSVPQRDWKSNYNVLYVGRDTPEKRFHLVLGIAERAQQKKLPFTFSIAGPDARRTVAPNLTFYGEVRDRETLAKLYRAAHFVIITSRSEGFPLSLMEGMAVGCIPLATCVGDIPFHLRDGGNALLLPDGDEDQVLDEALKVLQKIPSLNLPSISAAAHSYCESTFGYERFRDAYRSLLVRD